MNYLVNRQFADSVEGYLESPWPGEMAGRIHVVAYQDASALRELPAGTTLLSDHERFTPAQRELARRVWRALGEAGVPRLNDPDRVLRRAPLLDALHRAGINAFRAVPATEPLEGLRYPVFVREANEHTGTLTRLLGSRRELGRSLALLTRFGGLRPEDLLVVEFCDTRVGGTGPFPKYAVFRVGDRLIPRYLEFGEHWVVKSDSRSVTQELVERELDFMRRNPHEETLRRVFDLAGIDYGRADYGVLDGRVQVWEINTNPRIGPRSRARGGPSPVARADRVLRREAKEIFHASFREALKAIDRTDPGRRVPVAVDPDLRRRVQLETAGFWWRDRVKAGLRELRRAPTLRGLARRLADRV